jgi:N6-adenosine-specific RNA methylase IME4
MTALLRYDAACQAIAEAKAVDEVTEWIDKAAAVREYGRRIKNRQIEIDAIEIRVRAKQRRGELIRELKASGRLVTPRTARTIESPSNDLITLDDLGISRNESSEEQKIAAIPRDSFERLVARCRVYAEEHPEKHSFDVLTESQKVDKQSKDDQRRADHAARTLNGGTTTDLRELIASGYRAGAIQIDAPWKFKTRSAAGEGRSASLHYKTEGIQEIMALPVADLAAADCVLFMWIVDWCPQDALDLIKAWGFEHKTTAFTWAKENRCGEGWFMGQGYWTRANPEDCWLATRGHPKRLHADVRQLITAPVAEHSRKPDEIYERIERLVDGPYLELYARRERPGWMTWGDELPFPLVEGGTASQRVVQQMAATTVCVDAYPDIPNFLKRGATRCGRPDVSPATGRDFHAAN